MFYKNAEPPLGLRAKKNVFTSPFGMNLYGLEESDAQSTVPLKENMYQYNSKERETALNLHWYDYGTRQYDVQLGRWSGVDPHAENYYSWTSFNYVGNNPILMTDPDGRDWQIAFDEEKNHFTFSFRGKIIDKTDNVNSEHLENLANKFLDALTEVFTGSGEGISWSFDKENSYVEVASSEEDLEAHDHAIRIVEPGTDVGGKSIALRGGRAGFGSQAIYLSSAALGRACSESHNMKNFKISNFTPPVEGGLKRAQLL